LNKNRNDIWKNTRGTYEKNNRGDKNIEVTEKYGKKTRNDRNI
jgi:hypothetical protein